MKFPTIFAALAALLLPAPVFAQKIVWPEGRKAAIVLTYDDAAPTHLKNAIPQLDEAGIKGTFFLNARFGEGDVPGWRAAAKNGHELGNHTLFHPCPKGSFEMEKQYESEGYSTKGMLAEISAMNAFLAAIDGKTGRTMGLPCSVTLAGGADYSGALEASGLIRYVRGGAPDDGVIADPQGVDPFRVPSRGFPETATAEELIAYVKRVEASGGMGVIMFHGVGGDWLSVTNEAHRGLLKYLKDHQKDVWTAPFQTVMDHVKKSG